MAKNSYPAACAAVLAQYAPLAHTLAQASGLSIDDIRQELAVAWLVGQDPARAVPAALRVRRLPGGDWRSTDLHVAARAADLAAGVEPVAEFPRPRSSRGAVAASVAVDAGVGLRAAQKRLKRQRDAAGAGQGDLFMDGEV